LKKTSSETIMAGLERHLEAWTKIDKEFIPHPSTWLNREGWNDEPPQAKEESKPKERPIWHECATRCNNWDEQKRWCKRKVQQEPVTVEACDFF
jgi:hypothetical protein